VCECVAGGIKPRTSHKLGYCSTTELHTQPIFSSLNEYIFICRSLKVISLTIAGRLVEIGLNRKYVLENIYFKMCKLNSNQMFK
jgi:hypothetical protein